jgi:hypothetical protein
MAEALSWQTSLVRIPLAGGKPQRIVIPSGNQSADALAVSSTAAYVTQAPQAAGANGALLRVANDAQEPMKLADSEGFISAIAIDDTTIYFSDEGGTKSLPLRGGSVRVLSSNTTGSLVVVGETLYLSDNGVYAVSIETGQMTLLDSDVQVRELTACGADLCWLSGSALQGRIVRRLLDGESRVIADNLLQPHKLAVDQGGYFVTTGAAGLALLRVPASAGSVSMVWGGGALALALTADCLYWSTMNAIYGMSRAAADAANM